MRTRRTLSAVSAILAATALSAPAQVAEPEQVAEPAVELEYVTAPEVAAEGRLRSLARALDFESWPAGEELFVAPPVGRSLLPRPEIAGEPLRVCSVVRFGELPWGRCEWSWRRRAPADPTAGETSGVLELRITLTPGARAAQESLLLALTQNMLPPELLAETLRRAERPQGLGDVAFLLASAAGGDARLSFVRANLAVTLYGSGDFAGDVVAVARRLDLAILDQRPLTYEELLERRPTVTVGARPGSGGALDVDVSVPGDRELVAVRASVDGQAAELKARRLELGTREGPAEVEVVAVTRELLAATDRRQVGGDG